ncbi:MAG TPA: DUF1269 domain-containing protein [Solirubrobacteraceae bacterium]|jgi:uncharacterized membrane protein|nr:DUF1269 domain-containing protein [Solirubrobacteraceae bacterium]
MTTEDTPSGLDLVVVRFPGPTAAYEVFAAARDRAGGDAPWIHQVGFVEHHHNGRLVLRGMFAGHYVDVDEEDRLSEPGAAEGFAVGALVGLLGGPPGLAVGMVVGAIVGSQLRAPTQTEPEPRALVDQLRAALPRPSSAIVMIAPAQDVEEMLSALGDSGGEVIRQSLTPEQAAALAASLEDAPAESSGPSTQGEQAVEATEPGR